MKKEKRDFKGIWIPKDIWWSKDLSVMEKLFLVEIDSLDNDKGCYASNKYFAEFFQITKGRCSQIIGSLQKKGRINISIKREGKQIISRSIKVVNKLNTIVNKLNKPIKNSKEGYLENDKDNNTCINNTYKIIKDFFISEEKLLKQIGKTQFTNLTKIVYEKAKGYELLKSVNYFMAFIEWLEWKKEDGSSYKGKMGMKKILRESLEVGEKEAIKSIKTATGKWKGIFFMEPSKETEKHQQPYYEKF